MGLIQGQHQVVYVLYMDVLDYPFVNLIQLAGRQLGQISHCQHVFTGFAAAFWDQVAHCATDWEQEGALPAPMTWPQKYCVCA